MINTIDYNKQMHMIPRMGQKVLMHVCCAPCASGVFPRMAGFTVIPYFYNPNIDTKEEYDKRAAQFAKLGINVEICPYDHSLFEMIAEGTEDEPEGGQRCRMCITMRLERTAQRAKEIGADFFCSTLSVSPHKDAQFINEIGQVLARKYEIPFLPNDFKKENGTLLSVVRSKELGMYRQCYCGCELSRANQHKAGC